MSDSIDVQKRFVTIGLLMHFSTTVLVYFYTILRKHVTPEDSIFGGHNRNYFGRGVLHDVSY